MSQEGGAAGVIPVDPARIGCRLAPYFEGKDDMTRRIRMAAASVMVAAGLIGAVAAPASAKATTSKPAEALCTAAGGTFFPSIDHGLYACEPPEGQTFSEAQLRAAGAVCEHVYKAFGVRFVVLGPGEGSPETTYGCLLAPV
jgi:hypothetical protein